VLIKLNQIGTVTDMAQGGKDAHDPGAGRPVPYFFPNAVN
jgi:enolase